MKKNANLKVKAQCSPGRSGIARVTPTNVSHCYYRTKACQGGERGITKHLLFTKMTSCYVFLN